MLVLRKLLKVKVRRNCFDGNRRGKLMKRKNVILRELKEHWPLALVASLIAAALVIIISYFDGTMAVVENLFGILHPAHVLVSAAATSAIYYFRHPGPAAHKAIARSSLAFSAIQKRRPGRHRCARPS